MVGDESTHLKVLFCLANSDICYECFFDDESEHLVTMLGELPMHFLRKVYGQV